MIKLVLTLTVTNTVTIKVLNTPVVFDTQLLWKALWTLPANIAFGNNGTTVSTTTALGRTGKANSLDKTVATIVTMKSEIRPRTNGWTPYPIVARSINEIAVSIGSTVKKLQKALFTKKTNNRTKLTRVKSPRCSSHRTLLTPRSVLQVLRTANSLLMKPCEMVPIWDISPRPAACLATCPMIATVRTPGSLSAVISLAAKVNVLATRSLAPPKTCAIALLIWHALVPSLSTTRLVRIVALTHNLKLTLGPGALAT